MYKPFNFQTVIPGHPFSLKFTNTYVYYICFFFFHFSFPFLKIKLSKDYEDCSKMYESKGFNNRAL